MAKKPEKADQKKECPSCGLGVAPESSICEFCGWDFEEEDEWILQIEKLERDLMLEKQKFEPGTVNHMIETTLRTPVLERVQSSVPADEEAIEIEKEEEVEAKPVPQRSARAPVKAPAEPEPEYQSEPVRRVRSVKAPQERADFPVRKARPPAEEEPPTAAPQRRVRTVAAPPSGATEQEEGGPPTRKVRTVRKVKQ